MFRNLTLSIFLVLSLALIVVHRPPYKFHVASVTPPAEKQVWPIGASWGGRVAVGQSSHLLGVQGPLL